MTDAMFNLIETLCKKEKKIGPEYLLHLKGCELAEKYFDLVKIALENELRKYEDLHERPNA